MSSGLFTLLIPILLIAVFAFMFKNKGKKKNGSKEETVNTRRQDEVILLIKTWLKDNGVSGQTVVIDDVFKRNEKEFKKREVYVVLFKTKDSKTMAESEERAIEAELIKKYKSKKQFDKFAQINKELDLKKELVWIKPIKDKRDKFKNKEKERLAKREEKLKTKAKSKKQKVKTKNDQKKS